MAKYRTWTTIQIVIDAEDLEDAALKTAKAVRGISRNLYDVGIILENIEVEAVDEI
jgi:hypothetical protein